MSFFVGVSCVEPLTGFWQFGAQEFVKLLQMRGFNFSNHNLHGAVLESAAKSPIMGQRGVMRVSLVRWIWGVINIRVRHRGAVPPKMN